MTASDSPTDAADFMTAQGFQDQLRSAVEAGVSAARSLADGGPVGELDAASFGTALLKAGLSLGFHPREVAGTTMRFGTDVLRAGLAAAVRTVGANVEGPAPEKRDRRFADVAWQENAGYWLLRQYYEL